MSQFVPGKDIFVTAHTSVIWACCVFVYGNVAHKSTYLCVKKKQLLSKYPSLCNLCSLPKQSLSSTQFIRFYQT